MSELLELANNAANERNTKLKSIYPNFKSIADGRKQKESMKMSPEKFRQEFTI